MISYVIDLFYLICKTYWVPIFSIKLKFLYYSLTNAMVYLEIGVYAILRVKRKIFYSNALYVLI